MLLVSHIPLFVVRSRLVVVVVVVLVVVVVIGVRIPLFQGIRGVMTAPSPAGRVTPPSTGPVAGPGWARVVRSIIRTVLAARTTVVLTVIVRIVIISAGIVCRCLVEAVSVIKLVHPIIELMFWVGRGRRSRSWRGEDGSRGRWVGRGSYIQ